jgi:hypothetical protein
MAKTKTTKVTTQYRVRRAGGLPKSLRETFATYDGARIAIRSYLKNKGAATTTLGANGFSVQKVS